MPQPAPNRYRLTADPDPNNPNPPPSMTVNVDATGMNTTFGLFTYDAGQDWFHHPKADVIVRCLGNNRFAAIVRHGEPDQEEYEGRCDVL